MLLRCKCPGCGAKKEYIAEEVGSAADCSHCGQVFTLQHNRGRAAFHVLGATLGALILVGGISARVYFKAKRAEARHEAVHRHEQERRAASDD
jgi:uncharacterized protein (DUF983 family)